MHANLALFDRLVQPGYPQTAWLQELNDSVLIHGASILRDAAEAAPSCGHGVPFHQNQTLLLDTGMIA